MVTEAKSDVLMRIEGKPEMVHSMLSWRSNFNH